MPTATRLQTLNVEIRVLLLRHNLSLTDLARIIGVSQPQVSARLRGDVVWRIDELWALADRIGVPVAAILAPTTQPEAVGA